VELGGGGRAAGEDERLERRELRVDLVAGGLEPGRLFGSQPQPSAVAAVGDRDVGADVEQVVLDPLQECGEPGREPGQRERDAELGVQLVHRPVRLDPRMRLRHPAHVAQMGLAVVAEARVDPGEVHRHGETNGNIALVQGRWFREAGANPARTRHCDRGSPSH
jgi:hypothetical protein